MNAYLREGYVGTKFRPAPARTVSQRATYPFRAIVINKTFSDWRQIATDSCSEFYRLIYVSNRQLPEWGGVRPKGFV